jgi:hypothetical protein
LLGISRDTTKKETAFHFTAEAIKVREPETKRMAAAGPDLKRKKQELGAGWSIRLSNGMRSDDASRQ